MFEIKILGRGGQGGKTAMEILTSAFIYDGKYAKGFPEFGPERSGAPVQCSVRVSDDPIHSNQSIVTADCIIVLDETLLREFDYKKELKKHGIIVINSNQDINRYKNTIHHSKIFFADYSRISLNLFKKNLPNIPMLGAIIFATQLASLRSIETRLKEKFSAFPKEIIDNNILALHQGYKQTQQLL